MHHIISVGMNAETLRQLDELREFFPEAADRRQIIIALVREAHARLTQSKAEATTNESIKRAG